MLTSAVWFDAINVSELAWPSYSFSSVELRQFLEPFISASYMVLFISTTANVDFANYLAHPRKMRCPLPVVSRFRYPVLVEAIDVHPNSFATALYGKQYILLLNWMYNVNDFRDLRARQGILSSIRFVRMILNTCPCVNVKA